MPVVAEIQALLDQMADTPVDYSTITPEELRRLMALLSAGEEVVEVGSVEERAIPGPAEDIPVRIYRPVDAPTPSPVLVWFHGGGWVIGDVDTADATARRLCEGADVVVVSVGYRLAPEHPFPAGPEDAWAALRWVAAEIDALDGDAARLAVGGDSAGGNLAALVAIRARDEGGPHLCHQMLVYPGTDLTMAYPSIEENGEGYFLTRPSMEWFADHYLGADRRHGDPASPAVSPLFTPDLAGVAPAQVLTAEFDPLRDEGGAYAARLAEADVSVDLVPHPGLVHGFFSFGSFSPDAASAVTAAITRLRHAFSSSERSRAPGGGV